MPPVAKIGYFFRTPMRQSECLFLYLYLCKQSEVSLPLELFNGRSKPGRFIGGPMTITPPLTGLGQAHHGGILREVAALAESGPRVRRDALPTASKPRSSPLPDDSALALLNKLDQFSGLRDLPKLLLKFFTACLVFNLAR